jgi:hypothetical protein
MDMIHFNEINEIIEGNIKGSNWFPVMEYLSIYKNNINYSYNVNIIISKCILYYIYKLKNLNHKICYIEATKIFIKWLGVPSHYSEDYLNLLIYNNMCSLRLTCLSQSCFNKVCSQKLFI